MRRYGGRNTLPKSALSAWQTLGNSVYQKNPSGSHALILLRPAFGRGQNVSCFMSFMYLLEKILLAFVY